MDPMMMRNMMMARQMGSGPMGLKQSYGRPAPMNALGASQPIDEGMMQPMDANVAALQAQAQMAAAQYAPLAESQKVMGGLMAPQPNAMMAAAPVEGGMPMRKAASPGLMEARNRMIMKRRGVKAPVRGGVKMRPMAR